MIRNDPKTTVTPSTIAGGDSLFASKVEWKAKLMDDDNVTSLGNRMKLVYNNSENISHKPVNTGSHTQKNGKTPQHTLQSSCIIFYNKSIDS